MVLSYRHVFRYMNCHTNVLSVRSGVNQATNRDISCLLGVYKDVTALLSANINGRYIKTWTKHICSVR